ncbi:glycosyltransferase [Aquisphaera giovannonii]|uniref:glycosyltransferase n=1 Tax=Aquisphaera giovannonii TaxID=406548 RepID=UPI00143D2A8B|nr:glycosyltransferase [Aquisphaera giovannonii]
MLSLDVGGLERIVVNLVRMGGVLGQEPSVICVEKPGMLASQVDALGAPILCAEKPPGLNYGSVGRIREFLHRLKPDVVHTHQVGALLYAGPAARREKVPVVVHTEHGNRMARQRSLIRRARVGLLWAIGGFYVDRFFCVSEDIADSVRTSCIVPGRKVAVVPNGIDTSIFSWGGDPEVSRRELKIPPDVAVIGTVGRLDEVKSQDLLIRGFSRITDHAPAPHLLLVGDGTERPRLQHLADQLKISDRVHFAGYQSQPERFLGVMNVFALTSRSEGMPLSILEAWAAGLPVVASNVGGIPKLIVDGQTGLLFESGEETALADALSRLLTNTLEAARIGEAGRQHVRSRFDVEVMARNYGAHYEAFLPTRPADVEGEAQGVRAIDV